MRIELDANGYVLNVYWGCHSGKCTEYTGKVPHGYSNLNDWSENAFINAYYLDENRDLMLDADKLVDLEDKAGQQAIDNAPILYKELYGTSEILDSQYQSATATGKILTLENVKRTNPKVKLTNVDCYADSQVDIVTQGKNMLRNDAITETIAGVTFTKNIDGSIRINGTSTKEIEYNLSGSGTNATSIFVLKKGLDYHLNLGGLSCEMRFYDGTTSQVYVGTDGIINLPEDKKVTQVLIKIPSGTEVNNVIYPMLEYGTSASEYESYKARMFTIDLSDYISPEVLYPADDLYPSDDLYPLGTAIDYIYIDNGKISVSVNGSLKYSKGNVNLFDGFNTVYTLQDTNIEMTYCINVLNVDSLEFLQGKATTTNKFKILDDGSIEAHNGYFSGKIEAHDGYFSGIINGGAINVTDESTIDDPYVRIAKKDTDNFVMTSIWNNGISVCDYSMDGEDTLIRTECSDGFAELHNSEVNAFSFNNVSLEKVKKNIEKTKKGLDLIKKADVCSYNYRGERNGEKKHIGLVIGEEYNTPEEIMNSKKTGIDLYSMIAVAWQSIKELNTKVEELEGRIKELESDNNGEN